DQVEGALRLRGGGARRAGRVGPERTGGRHRAALGELGSIVGAARGGGRAVHARDPAVLERDEIAATQSRQPHAGIPFGGQIAVGGEPHGAAVGGGVEPAGDGGQRKASVR